MVWNQCFSATCVSERNQIEKVEGKRPSVKVQKRHTMPRGILPFSKCPICFYDCVFLTNCESTPPYPTTTLAQCLWTSTTSQPKFRHATFTTILFFRFSSYFCFLHLIIYRLFLIIIYFSFNAFKFSLIIYNSLFIIISLFLIHLSFICSFISFFTIPLFLHL